MITIYTIVVMVALGLFFSDWSERLDNWGNGK